MNGAMSGVASSATKCVVCDTPTLLLALTGRCGATRPDPKLCPFASQETTTGQQQEQWDQVRAVAD